MLPVDFPEANQTFTKPLGTTDEQCGELCAFIGQVPVDENGTMVPAIITKWQPSKEDIDAINRGEGIYLSMWGTSLTPIALFTENPFENDISANP